ANKQKKGERHVYGDLIIWKELINYSKKEKKPLIFVTDDRKEDWWTIEAGKTIRPREELIKEFYDLTGIRILIYNADHFLQYAKQKKLVPKLNDNTIKEVKEIRISDENRYSNINKMLVPKFGSNKSLNAFDYLNNPIDLNKSLSALDYFNNPIDLNKSLSALDYFNNPIDLNKSLSALDYLDNPIDVNKSLSALDYFNNQSNLNKPLSASQLL